MVSFFKIIVLVFNFFVILNAMSTQLPTPSPACSRCPDIEVITGSEIGTDLNIIQATGTTPDGCSILALSCSTPNAGSPIYFFWFENGTDCGTSSDKTTINRTLICNDNSELELTENNATAIVNQVACVSATI